MTSTRGVSVFYRYPALPERNTNTFSRRVSGNSRSGFCDNNVSGDTDNAFAHVQSVSPADAEYIESTPVLSALPSPRAIPVTGCTHTSVVQSTRKFIVHETAISPLRADLAITLHTLASTIGCSLSSADMSVVIRNGISALQELRLPASASEYITYPLTAPSRITFPPSAYAESAVSPKPHNDVILSAFSPSGSDTVLSALSVRQYDPLTIIPHSSPLVSFSSLAGENASVTATAVISQYTSPESSALADNVTPLSLGIETLGGVFNKIIERNTTIPVKKSQIYSTAADGQTSVEIHVLQGEREMARGNTTLGRFSLDGIPAAPRGVPQIEVTFDIDANGIVNVTAKDKGTGKEQHITITSSTNMSQEDIDKAVKEAEKFAEEDKKQKEAVDVKNRADNMIFQTEKTLGEIGDKIPESELGDVRNALQKLKETVKTDNTDAIKADTEALEQAFYKVSEKLYSQQQGGANPDAGAAGGGAAGGGSAGGDQTYYDPGFEDKTDK